MTRRAPISRRARTLRRIPPARPVRRAARSPVRIPISQEPHHHLKNCDGYTLRETDDAKRARRLSACLTDGVMAYAPLVRRLVALRTFRKAQRTSPMYDRLDADVKAVQALGQGKAPLYRHPRYRLASVVLRPRDPAHRDALLACPRAQLPIHMWQRRVTQKIARHYTHLQAMSRGRLALVFPVPRDATADEVRAVGHDLSTAVLEMTVVVTSAAATPRRRRQRPPSTRKKGGHPLPDRVDTNSPAFRQHIERLYAQSLLGGGISSSYGIFPSPVPAALAALVKASYANLPHDGVMMRPYHCVLDRVLRTPDATSAHLRVCAPHVKSAFQDKLKRSSLMWKRERDSNVQARLMHRMQEIRQSQKSTNTRASPHARKWNILEKSQANLAHTLAYAVLQCHREYNLIVLPLNVSSSSCHDHANLLLIDMRPRAARAAHQGRACLTWFEPNGNTFAQRTTIRCPKGSDTTATMLAQEVHHANRLLVKLDLASHQIDPQIDLASGQGIQTALGSQETRVQALTGQRQQCLQGFGVCGAITFWMLSMWIKKWHHKYPLFRDFQAAFERRLYHADPKVAMAKREEYKLRLRSFIAHVARSHVARSHVAPASSSQQSQFQRTVCDKVCDDVESYFLACPHLRRLGAHALARTPFKCVTNITYTFSPSVSVPGLHVRVPIRLCIASENKRVTLSFRSHQLQRTYAYAPDRTAHGEGSSPWMRVQNE